MGPLHASLFLTALAAGMTAGSGATPAAPANVPTPPADPYACKLSCGTVKFADFLAQARQCGVSVRPGACTVHSDGFYSNATPCVVTIDLRPLGPSTRVGNLDVRGDGTSNVKGGVLTLSMQSGIMVNTVNVSRPKAGCRKK